MRSDEVLLLVNIILLLIIVIEGYLLHRDLKGK